MSRSSQKKVVLPGDGAILPHGIQARKQLHGKAIDAQGKSFCLTGVIDASFRRGVMNATFLYRFVDTIQQQLVPNGTFHFSPSQKKQVRLVLLFIRLAVLPDRQGNTKTVIPICQGEFWRNSKIPDKPRGLYQ
jgi:hypothetical protein